MSAPSLGSTLSNMQPVSTQTNPDTLEVQHKYKLHQEETSDQEFGAHDSNSKFSPELCLFCSTESENISTNLLHMRKAHGFMIPAEEHLIVDMESLLGYLHVIIVDLRECIFCHTARRTPVAVQQHMIAKGHCRIDLESDEAEMLDFYDTPASDQQAYSGDHHEGGRSGKTRASSMYPTTRTTHATSNLHLSSGKTALARFHQAAASPGRYIATSDSVQASQTRGGQVVQTRQDKVADAVENRLTNLRANDRSSLVHLPRSQMLSILSTSQKQLSQAQKTERRILSRLESKNNSTMMKHFKNDVPGPKNG